MGKINSYIIDDVLRNRATVSLKEAHEVYMPQVSYQRFVIMLKKGGIPHLVCRPYKKEVDMLPVGCKRVCDTESGHIWDSITDAAFYLKVSRQAVVKAARTGRPCRGRIVQFA